MPADPAKIARALTPAQKRALLWLPADGTRRDVYQGGPHSNVLWRVRRKGLAIDVGVSVFRASPLGLVVRELLEKERTDG